MGNPQYVIEGATRATDNPHFITMEDYLEILEDTLRGTGGGFFGRPSHPEDVGTAVESANQHIEAVLSYQVRKWWDDQRQPKVVIPEGVIKAGVIRDNGTIDGYQ